MSPNAPRKPGRAPKYVTDETGNPIVGLSAQPVKKNGAVVKYRYYATHSKPRKWFGFHLAEALPRFYHWQSEQAETTVELRGRSINLPDGTWTLNRPGEPAVKIKGKITPVHDISEASFATKLREMLATPKGCRQLARMTGYKQLGYLSELDAPTDSIKLHKIREVYAERDFNDPNELTRSLSVWDEFVTAVKATTISEISEDAIYEYHRQTCKKFAPKTIKNRYAKLANILNYVGQRRKKYRQDLNDLKADIGAVCNAPKRAKSVPTPIAIDDFHALYNAAEIRWKAILLCMLNFACHPKEAGEIRKSEIDRKARSFITTRTKTGELRGTRVWSETLDAIKAYQDTQEGREAYQNSEFLFITSRGKPYRSGGLTYYFRDTLIAKTTVSDGCKLDDIRDGAQNAADEGGADSLLTAMLMGHALPGAMGAYKERTPKKTEKSVEAIREHYKIAELVR